MKKVLSILLALMLVVGLTSITALAAADTHTSASDADLTLVEGKLEVVDPTPDPDDPSNPDDPELPGIQVGSKALNFGKRVVKSGVATYSATTYEIAATDAATVATEEPKQELPANKQLVGVAVSDARGGEGKWTLSVKASAFTDGTRPSLEDAQIALTKEGNVAGLGSATPPAESTPTALDVVLDASATGTAKVIFKSNTGGSPGKWGSNFGAKLTVKSGSATAAAHKATLTWTLVAGV